MQQDIAERSERRARAGDSPAAQSGPPNGADKRNVGQVERVISSLLGGALLMSALRQPSAASAARALGGGALLHRGVTGRCYVYRALGRNTAESAQRRTEVQRSITIGRSADELYRAWRDPEHISAIMGQFARVEGAGEGRFRWSVFLPGKRELTWTTRSTEAAPGERISWRTEPDAPFVHEGSVRFRKAPGGKGTEVTLRMSFGPLPGALQALTSKFLRKIPQALEDSILRRCKNLCEAGEIPTLEHNPAARTSSRREAAKPLHVPTTQHAEAGRAS